MLENLNNISNTIVKELPHLKNFQWLPPPPPPTYTLEISGNQFNETSIQIINVLVTTENVPDGTILYLNIDSSSNATADDFETKPDSVTINDNSGSVSWTLKADVTTEGNETLKINLLTDSISGTVVATSEIITINDTSTGILGIPFNVKPLRLLSKVISDISDTQSRGKYKIQSRTRLGQTAEQSESSTDAASGLDDIYVDISNINLVILNGFDVGINHVNYLLAIMKQCRPDQFWNDGMYKALVYEGQLEKDMDILGSSSFSDPTPSDPAAAMAAPAARASSFFTETVTTAINDAVHFCSSCNAVVKTYYSADNDVEYIAKTTFLSGHNSKALADNFNLFYHNNMSSKSQLIDIGYLSKRISGDEDICKMDYMFEYWLETKWSDWDGTGINFSTWALVRETNRLIANTPRSYEIDGRILQGSGPAVWVFRQTKEYFPYYNDPRIPDDYLQDYPGSSKVDEDNYWVVNSESSHWKTVESSLMEKEDGTYHLGINRDEGLGGLPQEVWDGSGNSGVGTPHPRNNSQIGFSLPTHDVSFNFHSIINNFQEYQAYLPPIEVDSSTPRETYNSIVSKYQLYEKFSEGGSVSYRPYVDTSGWNPRGYHAEYKDASNKTHSVNLGINWRQNNINARHKPPHFLLSGGKGRLSNQLYSTINITKLALLNPRFKFPINFTSSYMRRLGLTSNIATCEKDKRGVYFWLPTSNAKQHKIYLDDSDEMMNLMFYVSEEYILRLEKNVGHFRPAWVLVNMDASGKFILDAPGNSILGMDDAGLTYNGYKLFSEKWQEVFDGWYISTTASQIPIHPDFNSNFQLMDASGIRRMDIVDIKFNFKPDTSGLWYRDDFWGDYNRFYSLEEAKEYENEKYILDASSIYVNMENDGWDSPMYDWPPTRQTKEIQENEFEEMVMGYWPVRREDVNIIGTNLERYESTVDISSTYFRNDNGWFTEFMHLKGDNGDITSPFHYHRDSHYHWQQWLLPDSTGVENIVRYYNAKLEKIVEFPPPYDRPHKTLMTLNDISDNLNTEIFYILEEGRDGTAQISEHALKDWDFYAFPVANFEAIYTYINALEEENGYNYYGTGGYRDLKKMRDRHFEKFKRQRLVDDRLSSFASDISTFPKPWSTTLQTENTISIKQIWEKLEHHPDATFYIQSIENPWKDSSSNNMWMSGKEYINFFGGYEIPMPFNYLPHWEFRFDYNFNGPEQALREGSEIENGVISEPTTTRNYPTWATTDVTAPNIYEIKPNTIDIVDIGTGVSAGSVDVSWNTFYRKKPEWKIWADATTGETDMFIIPDSDLIFNYHDGTTLYRYWNDTPLLTQLPLNASEENYVKIVIPTLRKDGNIMYPPTPLLLKATIPCCEKDGLRSTELTNFEYGYHHEKYWNIQGGKSVIIPWRDEAMFNGTNIGELWGIPHTPVGAAEQNLLSDAGLDVAVDSRDWFPEFSFIAGANVTSISGSGGIDSKEFLVVPKDIFCSSLHTLEKTAFSMDALYEKTIGLSQQLRTSNYLFLGETTGKSKNAGKWEMENDSNAFNLLEDAWMNNEGEAAVVGGVVVYDPTP